MIDPHIETAKLRQYFNFAFALIAGFGVAIGLLLGLEAYGGSQFGSGAQVALEAVDRYAERYKENKEASEQTRKEIEELRDEVRALSRAVGDLAKDAKNDQSTASIPQPALMAPILPPVEGK